ncbi:MAG: ATP-binding protein, partial [FCB group bacterium]|nr:ATP-binding protein [FCB group bacterium]
MPEQSTLIFIIGKSGRGKSTAIRTLPPEDTYLINVIGKPLPFPGGTKYQKSKNLCTERDALKIIQHMQRISKAGFTHLVLDDMQYIMAGEFMLKALER